MEPTVRIPSAAPSHVRVPPELEGLRRLAYNLYWSWHPQARALFARINGGVWARVHSPIPVLTSMVDWPALLDNSDFMVQAQRVIAEFDRYMANGADHWFHRRHARDLQGPIAYFCAEYGLHESLGIYSGGLGVLAGDHMKAASDMALPLVGVGLLYRNGYFRQTIDADGHQEHRYPDYDLSRMPLTRALGREGDALTVSVALPGRNSKVDGWTV
jgi:glycogen phosphorylase